MYQIKPTSKFKKDYKQAVRRGYNIKLLEEVITTLAAGKALPSKNRDHSLTGKWSGYRECHIVPDWLLVYRIDHLFCVLALVRTGTHSDLF